MHARRRYREYLVRMLASALWVLAAGCGAPASHAGDVRLAIEFTHMGGDLFPAQREAMLRTAKIQAEYLPSVEIPGVTAHWEQCGLLLLPCLKPETHRFRPADAAVQYSDGTLTFSVPRRHGSTLHRLNTLVVELQGPHAFPRQPAPRWRLYIRVDCELCRLEDAPFLAEDDGRLFQLGGFIRTQGVKIGTDHACDPGNCVFPEMGRFDGYALMLEEGGKTVWWGASRQEVMLQEPYPDELQGLEVVRAKLVATRLDGHLLERIELHTRQANSCSTQREVFLVDGKATIYRRHAQGRNCSTGSENGRTVLARWSEDGRPLLFDDFRIEWGLREVVPTWTAWQGERKGASEPSAQMLSELQKEGVRLRQYFGSVP